MFRKWFGTVGHSIASGRSCLLESQIWSGLRPSGPLSPASPLPSPVLDPLLGSGARDTLAHQPASLCAAQRTVAPGELLANHPPVPPWACSPHPLLVPLCPVSSLHLIPLPPQGRAPPCSTECQGLLGGEQGGGPGGVGDRSLESPRWRGQGASLGARVRQPRAAAAPLLCAFAHADPLGGPSSLCPSALGPSSRALF